MRYILFIGILAWCFFTFSQVTPKEEAVFSSSVSSDSIAIKNNSLINRSTLSIDLFFELADRANSLPGQKQPTQAQLSEMKNFVAKSKQIDDKGFDYSISAFITSGYDVSKKTLLDQAKALQPTNKYVLTQSVGVNYILSNEQELKNDLTELVKQNNWTKDELNYAKDVLESVEKNGFLITHGINDSYPIIYQQFINNSRKDVQVIPMHLLVSEQYRNRLAESNLNIPGNTSINTAFIKNLCTINDNSLIYFALTVSPEYFKPMDSQLYPIGLTFHYSKIAVQNTEQNIQLWSKLKNTLHNFKDEKGKELAANYLPLLINLYEYYNSVHNNKLKSEIKSEVKAIGTKINNPNLINELQLIE
ncbi:MAG: hypothetical protein M9916_08120 [Crocinitomicaceae bacterium]|nr:hypothetical protein [Crocinitomicaceae bacterium]